MSTGRPNVVVVLADDLGWGDLGCYGATVIPTPHIDDLAGEGVRIMDAHAASSVCTPSRYSLLTGRYPWRSPLKQGVLMGHAPGIIEPDRPTLASVFKDAGYETAAIGKWHLGLGWRHTDGTVWSAQRPGDPLEYQLGDPLARHDSRDLDAGEDIDYTSPFEGGPLELGFDRFFGIAGSLNMPPYTFLEGERTVGTPREWKTRFLPGQRPGRESPGWDEHEVDLTFVDRATSFITEREHDRPFLLYFAPSAPHRPQVSPKFVRGASGGGSRGDSVVFVDWMVGQLVGALEETGQLEDTIVVITSDNGSPTIFADELSPDHRPNGPWRGQKGDVWEGGHREPLIVRWPQRIPPRGELDESLDLIDLFRTLATLVGVQVPPHAAPDSTDRSEVLLGVGRPGREPGIRVLSSMGGALCALHGPWKAIFAKGSGGGLTTYDGGAEEGSGQLYNLDEDPGESLNRWSTEPGIVAEIRALLAAIVGSDLSPRTSETDLISNSDCTISSEP
ncbi:MULTISPECIES: arylsulfatase [Microcella]|uniref:sulfatase family protein n=1 Tax=Microcella TaxID=337004 RepID=UPI0015CEF722|nr:MULTISPECIES: arylsulfatase [Microcella]QOD93371.1 arylsulfatase [Chryseoglobus sp. 28M-23]